MAHSELSITKDVSITNIEVRAIRDLKVLLSSDLAELYGVEHRVLMQAVKRNAERFPDDFMFQLTADEVKNLKSHSVISSWGGSRKQPYAFTEQGIAMLSSVLRSDRAVQVNIYIMRLFVKMRHEAAKYEDLAKRLQAIEEALGTHSQEFQLVYSAIQQLMTEPDGSGRKIGFRQINERRKRYASK